MAAARFSRSTSDGRSALYAGANSACPIPMASTIKKIKVNDGSLDRTTKPSATENSACSTDTQTRSIRRSTKSATQPPMMESSSSGPSCANTMSPT